MTSPIADGIYNIPNVQFPGSVVQLTRGLPYAAINGITPGPSTNSRWIVKNVGNNQITLENVTARGFYASVYVYYRATPLFASPNPTFWTVKEVSTGIYTLEARGFQLALTRDGLLTTILLGPLWDNSPAEEQQWKFEPVGN